MQFGTVNDMSNSCMFPLLSKLGCGREGSHPTSICMIDRFPIRLDRKKMPNDNVFSHIPRAIQQYWTDKVMELLDLCEDALLVLIFGSSTQDAYAPHLRDARADYTIITGSFTGTDRACSGFMLHRTSSSGERVLYRIVPCVPHPKAFLEVCGHNIGIS
jgi:hypothetical protein